MSFKSFLPTLILESSKCLTKALSIKLLSICRSQSSKSKLVLLLALLCTKLNPAEMDLVRLELMLLRLPGVSRRFCIAIATECLLGLGGFGGDVAPAIIVVLKQTKNKFNLYFSRSYSCWIYFPKCDKTNCLSHDGATRWKPEMEFRYWSFKFCSNKCKSWKLFLIWSPLAPDMHKGTNYKTNKEFPFWCFLLQKQSDLL